MKKIFSLLVIVCILAGCVGAPVITSAQSTNLALASAGAVVTASGSTGVRDVSHINDGDNIEETLDAWWSNKPEQGDIWLEFDLGKIAIIDQIVFYAFTLRDVKTASVKTSIDGTNWTETALKWTRTEHYKFPDTTYVNYKHEHTFEEPVLARYLKFEPTAQAKLHEVEIFGEATAILNNISLEGGNGEELTPAFDREILDYQVFVPSFEQLPVVTAELGSPECQLEIEQPALENDYCANVKVILNNIPVLIYTVQFYELSPDSAELGELLLSVDGAEPIPLADFNAARYEYIYFCDGTSHIPVVSARALNPKASVMITQATEKTMTASVTVTSANGENTAVYTIEFPFNISMGRSGWESSAYSGRTADKALDNNFFTSWFGSAKVPGGGYMAVNLESISKIYGVSVYTDQTTNTGYFNKLLVSTDGDVWTEVAGTVNVVGNSTHTDGGATVTVNHMKYTFEELPILAKYVKITGSTNTVSNSRIQELVILGIREPVVSANAYLQELALSHGSIPSFTPYVSDYTVKLNPNDSIPSVSAVAEDAGASVAITQATEDNPVARVTVTAENGVSEMTYTITFEKQLLPEKNNYLSLLSVKRGTLLPNFTPANTAYTVYLQPGSAPLASDEIQAQADVSGAKVEITVDPAVITVTSKDGSAVRTYTIATVYASADLADLIVDGYSMTPNFSPSVMEYTIELEAGEGLPQLDVNDGGRLIRPVAADGTTVSITQPTEKTMCAVISVADENDLLRNHYLIRFQYAQSLAEAEQRALEALRDYAATNSTSADDLMQLVEKAVTNSRISMRWSTEFSKTNATGRKAGLITGCITLQYGEESASIDIRKAIARLEGGSSGGSGGSGHVPGNTNSGGIFIPPSKPEVQPGIPPEETTDVPDPYQEVRGHWAEEEVIWLIENGIVNGNGSSFALDNVVTRAEFIAMLVRGSKLEVSEYSHAFSDVAPSDWFAPYIQTAADKGFMEGFDGKASPAQPIVREEAAKILVGVYELLNGTVEATEPVRFADSGAISSWAALSVQKAAAKGLIQGFETNEFKGRDTLTRAQAMTMVYRLMHAE